jgi:UDP-N-acetylenolpyruvoylglucosamine reductase
VSNPESYPALARVGISTRDAIAIVNRGGTTASDVQALKDQIQHRVEEIWSARNRNDS